MTDPLVAPEDCRCDVVVVGAGAVGTALAIALAGAGFDTVLVGPEPAERPGRTVALLEGSIRLLARLGLWEALESQAEAMSAMRIVDATGSLFRPPPVTFHAADIGLPAFGCNIETRHLEHCLSGRAANTAGLRLYPSLAVDFTFGPEEATVALSDRTRVAASLIVAADGRMSLARKKAGIGVRSHSYPQVALTSLLTHTAPHGGLSTEFHTREGPCTLVPLPRAAGGAHRSSLVWVMRPAEAERRRALDPVTFAAEIERQTQRLLGSIAVEGAVGAFPITTSVSARLTGPRLVLTGEAAHALPPIGAQGLNLSLRDVDVLVCALAAARQRGRDCGSDAVLTAYARSRRTDVDLRTLGVDALNGSLLADNPAVDFLRGAGLGALGTVGPLRRWVMRRGLAPKASTVRVHAKAALDAKDGDRRSSARP